MSADQNAEQNAGWWITPPPADAWPDPWDDDWRSVEVPALRPAATYGFEPGYNYPTFSRTGTHAPIVVMHNSRRGQLIVYVVALLVVLAAAGVAYYFVRVR